MSEKVATSIGAVVALAVLAIGAWMILSPPISQYEVTLGDGSKATCIVVSVRGGGGVTCIPHMVVGPDEEVEP
jgi:hypothetical protein